MVSIKKPSEWTAFWFCEVELVLRSDIGKEIPAKMQSVHKKFTCQLLCRQATFTFRGQSRSCPLFYIMHSYCFGAQKFAVKKERRANREWRGKGEKYEKEIILRCHIQRVPIPYYQICNDWYWHLKEWKEVWKSTAVEYIFSIGLLCECFMKFKRKVSEFKEKKQKNRLFCRRFSVL